MRVAITLGNHLGRLELGRALALVVAWHASACHQAAPVASNPTPDDSADTGARMPLDSSSGEGSRRGLDAGGADASGPADARALPQAGSPDADTGQSDANVRDASSVSVRDAQSFEAGLDAAQPDALLGAAQCNVDACNNAGTCIVRDWWTECECDPSALPQCEYPRFRAVGPSRTDFERTMYLMSGDGHVVAGSHGFDPSSRESVGVTWTPQDGLVMLEQDPAGPTLPTGINEDGSLIAGRVERPNGHSIDVLWRNGALERVSPDAGTEPVSGAHPIAIPDDGSVASQTFSAFDSTDDGKLAVGRAARDANSTKEAAFWTAEGGVVFLTDYLIDHAVDVRRWDLWHVNAVSDDGKTLLGLGIGPDVGYRWYLQLEARP